MPYQITPATDYTTKFPHIMQMAKALSLQYVHEKVVLAEQLKTIGTALWESCIDTTAFEQQRQQTGTQSLQIVINSNNAAIQALPWECLYHPNYGFVGKQGGFSISRHISDLAPLDQALPKGPLKVLLFTSLPDDLDAEKARLDIETEQAHVLEALDPLIRSGHVELEVADDGRFSHLQEQLNHSPYHLVFLSGHGLHQHQQIYNSYQSVFLFEADDGRSQAIKQQQLAQAFQGSGVQCVVLSACQSGKLASDELSSSLSIALLQAGVAHVIGMRESVFDAAGHVFAKTLCEQLKQQPLSVAVQKARQAISQTKLDRAKLDQASLILRDEHTQANIELTYGQWSLPLLYSRQQQDQLIDWQFNAQAPQPRLITYQQLAGIELPQQFIGRRKALRELHQRLQSEPVILIQGMGGQGKTSLMGRIADKYQKLGYEVLAWTARRDSNLNQFEIQARERLPAQAAQQMELLWQQTAPQERITILLQALQTHLQNKLILLFDNVESVQNDAGELLDENLQHWINACQHSQSKTLLTSRKALKGVVTYPLTGASYGDFIRFHQALNLPYPEYRQRLYQQLGGNFKALEFFSEWMQVVENDADIETALNNAREDISSYGAIDKLIALLSREQKALLVSLQAYPVAVTQAGIAKLQQPIDIDASIQRLQQLSLLDQMTDPHLRIPSWQINGLVADYLARQHLLPSLSDYQQAAEYLVWVIKHQKPFINDAFIAHAALQKAQQDEAARQLAYAHIIDYLDMRGFYRQLIKDWLPDITKSDDQKLSASGIGYTGKIYLQLGDYDSALPYFQQALSIRQQVGDKAGEGTTLNNISQIYHDQGDLDTALQYLKQSLSIAQQIGDKAGEGTTLNNISAIYRTRGDLDTALQYLKQCLTIFQEIGDKTHEGGMLNNLSQIYKARGDFDTALQYLQQSLSITQQIGDKASEGTTLNNISQIFKARGDLDTALQYLKQCLTIFQEIGDKTHEGTTLNNISQIYQDQGDFDTALQYLKQSLSIQQQIGDKTSEGATLNNISPIYYARGDFDTALQYLKQSLSIQQEIGDKAGEGATLKNMAFIAWKVGDKNQALALWQAAYQIAHKIGYAELLNTLDSIAQQLGESGLDYWENLNS